VPLPPGPDAFGLKLKPTGSRVLPVKLINPGWRVGLRNLRKALDLKVALEALERP